MSTEEKYETLENLKIIAEERKKKKDEIATCEWCGSTYPKGSCTYYKILVQNMSKEKTVENISKELIKDDDFERYVICSDCYNRLKWRR